MRPELSRTLASIWTLAILILVLIPPRSIPDVEVTNIDKLVHFSMFAVLGLLLMASSQSRQSAVWAVIFGSLYAVVTEILQGLVPWDRSPDPYDVLANLLGLYSACLAYTVRRRYMLNKAADSRT